jgi:hypothetical protein
MSSRQYGRILIITLFLSAGASTLAHAQRPPARSVSPRAGATVEERSAGRTLFEAVQNLLGDIRDFSCGLPRRRPLVTAAIRTTGKARGSARTATYRDVRSGRFRKLGGRPAFSDVEGVRLRTDDRSAP